jgi:hypothetical protein
MMANLPLIEDFPPFSAHVPMKSMKTWIFPSQNPPSRPNFFRASSATGAITIRVSSQPPVTQVDDGVRSLEGWKFPPQHAFAFHGIPKIRVAPFWFFSFSVGVLVFCLSSSIPFCQSFLCSVCLFRN